MKIVIAHAGVKREIRGGFAVCADRGTLLRIVDQLLRQVDEKFTYGWVEIPEPVFGAEMANNPPRPWAE